MLDRTFAALAAVALTAGTLALSTPLHAADLAEQRVAVSIADLDLASAGGVATLKKRVRAAARTVCGQASAGDVAIRDSIEACRADAVAGARREMATAIAAARGDNGQLALRDR